MHCNINKLFIISSILICGLETLDAQEKFQTLIPDRDPVHYECGAPIVNAVATDLAQSGDHAKKYFSAISSQMSNNPLLKEGLSLISNENMERLREQISPSSKEEKVLFAYLLKTPIPSVHRTIRKTGGRNESFSMLRDIIEIGALIAPAMRKQLDRATPGIEHALFSAMNCIFTSVGPPEGISDYGVVKIIVAPYKQFAWGSLTSGWSFIRYNIKGNGDYLPTAADATPGAKIEFARQVFTNDHWQEAFALNVIKHLREGKNIYQKRIKVSSDRILNDLNNAIEQNKSTKVFEIISDHRLAYLEGHYIEPITLENMEKISLERRNLAEYNQFNISKLLDSIDYNDQYQSMQNFSRLKHVVIKPNQVGPKKGFIEIE